LSKSPSEGKVATLSTAIGEEMNVALGLFSGLRVLEIWRFVAAPFCTRLLADPGPDVIKIEHWSAILRQWGKRLRPQANYNVYAGGSMGEWRRATLAG
jgi:hypothetical protein